MHMCGCLRGVATVPIWTTKICKVFLSIVVLVSDVTLHEINIFLKQVQTLPVDHSNNSKMEDKIILLNIVNLQSIHVRFSQIFQQLKNEQLLRKFTCLFT